MGINLCKELGKSDSSDQDIEILDRRPFLFRWDQGIEEGKSLDDGTDYRQTTFILKAKSFGLITCVYRHLMGQHDLASL